MKKIKDIKIEISNGDILSAIRGLKEFASSSKIVDKIIVQESRFNHNEKSYMEGTLGHHDHTVERNKITTSLLAICSELEKTLTSKKGSDKSTSPKLIPPSKKKAGSLADQMARLEALQTGGDTFCYCMLYNFDLNQIGRAHV